MSAWWLRAKCRDMDPERFAVSNLTPGRENVEATALCAGCTVIPECAGDALAGMNVSQVLRGPFKTTLAEADDVVPQSGVVRAGMVIPEIEVDDGVLPAEV
ncbi:WhiB family transcription factor [Gordonia phage Neville]|uniref:WhiB family transcription factor n=1 Tax=Gordonia phage Neville TaxID=2301693 RepID=A0A385DYB9_9CAUD|nr:WhiB family transcription factor [Gordonia phage Neville]AXQ64431.1 WhiB family transcription factor [Gordonia phage Neville]